jgi:hypothetical protein
MHATWIRCVDDVLIRSDAVILLRNTVDGLFAETPAGRAVQLTRTDCPSTTQLALLDQVRSSESAADGSTRVIIAVEGKGKVEWRRESAGTLIDLVLHHGATNSLSGALNGMSLSQLRSHSTSDSARSSSYSVSGGIARGDPE